MPDDLTFLRAIVADGDSDGPRLVYADWLEERGELLRAEFIRVQCALPRLSAADPRRPALEARQSELLHRHGDRWADPLRRELGLSRAAWGGWVFLRGFVEYFRLSADAFFQHIDALAELTPIRELCLSGLTGDRTPLLTGLPIAPRLRALNLDRCRLGDAGAEALSAAASLAGLRRLDLSGCNIGDDGVAALAASPHLAALTWLDLSGNPIGDEGIWRLIDSPHLTNLARLELYSSGAVRHDIALRQRFGAALRL